MLHARRGALGTSPSREVSTATRHIPSTNEMIDIFPSQDLTCYSRDQHRVHTLVLSTVTRK